MFFDQGSGVGRQPGPGHFENSRAGPSHFLILESDSRKYFRLDLLKTSRAVSRYFRSILSSSLSRVLLSHSSKIGLIREGLLPVGGKTLEGNPCFGKEDTPSLKMKENIFFS